MKRTLGDVYEIALPDGRFAYGRVYRDAALAFYRRTSDRPGEPPVGSRDFSFTVAVSDQTMKTLRRVGNDPFGAGEDSWPPASSVRDPITGAWSIYHRGAISRASEAEAAALEPAAVWEAEHLLARLASRDIARR